MLNGNYSKFRGFFPGLGLFLLLIIIFGSLVYLLDDLSQKNVFIIFFTSLALAFFQIKKFQKNQNKKPEKTWKHKIFDFTAATVLLCVSAIIMLYFFYKSSDQALQSPWQVTNKKFFILFCSFFIAYSFLIYKKSSQNFTGFLALATASSAALLVYKLGYGFDTHVHEAALKEIASKGYIFPKTLYYTGMYAVEIVASKITAISPILIHRLLVPTAGALILALSAVKFGNKFLIPALILSPFLSSFVVSNPFNFSFLLLISQVMILFRYFTHEKYEKHGNKTDREFNIKPTKNIIIFGWILAFAIFLIHPLTGIVSILLQILFNIKRFLKTTAAFGVAGILIIFAPVAAFLANEKSKTNAMPGLAELAQRFFEFDFFPILPKINLDNHFSFTLNAVYSWNEIIIPVYILLSVLGIIHYYRKCGKLDCVKIFIFTSICLILSSLLSIIFNRFPYVAVYESSDFPKRLLIMAFALMLPFYAKGLEETLNLFLNSRKKIIAYSGIVATGLIMAANSYLSYPRTDRAYSSHLYSTSASDLNAAIEIQKYADKNAEYPKNYAVLANQQTSAGALKIFGFGRTLESDEGEIYFYSIPTGGKMYNYYLKILDSLYADDQKIAKQYINEALSFANVEIVFFAINDYWWRDNMLIESAKKIAKDIITIDNNKINIFVFKTDS